MLTFAEVEGGYEVVRYDGNLTAIKIPATYQGKPIVGIGNGAFKDCVSLTSITIPNGVASIGNSAFYGCRSLTSITIPNGVASIGNSAFYGCRSLTSITIPNSVTSIGDSAFWQCTSLTSITIPDGVTSIGDDAFYGCTNLQYTVYENAAYLGNTNNPYVCLVKAKDKNITECTIHAKAKAIYSDAFSYCMSLTSITIPGRVTSIGSRAFYGCTNLKYVGFDGTEAQWRARRLDLRGFTVTCTDGYIAATGDRLVEDFVKPLE